MKYVVKYDFLFDYCIIESTYLQLSVATNHVNP